MNVPTSGIPRTRDGKPNLTAATPKAPDGKPDLSGVWMHDATPLTELRRLFGPLVEEAIRTEAPGMEFAIMNKYTVSILADLKPEETSMRPEAAEQMRRNQLVFNSSDACSADFVWGFPLAGLLAEPIKIVQAPRLTMILYEVGNFHRQIYTDGRTLAKEFDLLAFNGYSAGHWERDTLVVETGGFNDKTRFDFFAHPHSDGLRVTERFRRRDFGHLDIEMTFDDPKLYTKPFTNKVSHTLHPDWDIFEMYCENEKDRVHLPKP